MWTNHKLKTILCHQSYHKRQKQPKILEINHRFLELSISSLWIEPVHLFVDLLVEVQRVMLDTSSSDNIAVISTVHQHLDMKKLPTIEVLTFNRHWSCWPNLFENFKIMVYLKTTFNDTNQMTRLVSVLTGEAERLVESNDETVYLMQQFLNI